MRATDDGHLSYDLFARGAARLSARLAARLGDDEEHQEQQQHRADATAPSAATLSSCRWRWVEHAAPLTGVARVGVLALERWLPAAAAAAAASSAAPEPQEQDDEASVAVNTQQQNHHRYVFHAAHSAVYRVPVLCFRAERADGAPLGPEQVRADLSPWLEMHGPALGGDVEEAKEDEQDERAAPSSSWEFYLARGEHPAGPFPGAPSHVYYLHPCRTAERMALLMTTGGENQQQQGAANREQDDAEAEAASRYLAAWLSAVSPAVGLPRPPQPEEDQEAAETTRRRRE